jgi:hypothetical protein
VSLLDAPLTSDVCPATSQPGSGTTGPTGATGLGGLVPTLPALPTARSTQDGEG